VRVKKSQDRRKRHDRNDGLFVAIGHTPATEIFRGQIDMDERGLYPHRAGFHEQPALPGVIRRRAM
jgi:thioredoxin reductase (NADPH)